MTGWGVPTGKINDILALDVDVKGNGYETIKSLEIPETFSQKTPSGGRHFVFKYPAEDGQWGNKVKFLPGLDSRGDGGYIVAYEFDNKPIATAPRWYVEGARAYSAIPATNGALPGATIKVAPEVAQKIIEAGIEAIREAPAGEANNTLNAEAFKFGQLVASESITREYAAEALYRAARARGKPDYESRATINSGLDGGSRKPTLDPFGAAPLATLPGIPSPRGEIWTPAPTTREELLDYTKLRKPPLFEHWSSEDIAITTADGGTGKTTLKLFEAVCLALGERFLGFKCSAPGKTLFITGEDTDKKLKSMLGQIVRQMGFFDDPRYNDEIRTITNSIYIKKDSEMQIIVKEPRTNFLMPNRGAMERVMEAVEVIKPKLIIFDPISSFWGSEAALNDMAKAVSKFMAELVERANACVEMINHMGKQSSGTKDMTQFAGRGGTGLPSHARISRTLRPVFDDEYLELTSQTLTDQQSAMLCNVNKFSDGSPLYNKPFLIVREGFLFSRKALADAKAREAEEKLSDSERIFDFVKSERKTNKFPSKDVIIAHFHACGDPIGESRVKRSLHLLEYEGHLGELLRKVPNPDQARGGEVYVLVDVDGREI